MNLFKTRPLQLTCYLFLGAFASELLGHQENLETIIVEGREINLVGDAISASEGLIGQTEIDVRPTARTGEILEFIPGMVVTQHSGSGKANQYFLRGFNLDHGTDFATVVDGMPVNMRSHGHGQGYTDLSFLMPETIDYMAYKKGAYYADVGDFSGAGGVDINTLSQSDRNVAKLGMGENGYERAFFLYNFQHKDTSTIVAAERQHYDGPWTDIDEDVGKSNFFAKHSVPLTSGELSVSLMGYDNSWNSADQIPSRAVQQGLVSRYGSIDNTVGGKSSRYSLSINAQNGGWRASAYAIDYDLNLWSNFTYFLDDETDGDQFEQVDRRRVYGGQLEYSQTMSVFNKPLSNKFGMEFQIDDIEEVGLYHTKDRARLGVTRSDSIDQTSISFYGETRVDWSHHFRT